MGRECSLHTSTCGHPSGLGKLRGNSRHHGSFCFFLSSSQAFERWRHPYRKYSALPKPAARMDNITAFRNNATTAQVYRSFYIVLKDIDNVKCHSQSDNYKYSTTQRQEQALELLRRQYALKARNSANELVPIVDGQAVLVKVARFWTRYTNWDVSRLFVDGTSQLPPNVMAKLEASVAYLTEERVYEDALIVHSITDVDSMLATATAPSEEAACHSASDGSLPGTSCAELFRRPSKRLETQATPEDEQAMYDMEPERSAIDPSSRQLDANHVDDCMSKISRLVDNATIRLFQFFGISGQDSILGLFNLSPDQKLERLYAACLGKDWRAMRSALQPYHRLTASNVLKTLVGAFLFHAIMKDASDWQRAILSETVLKSEPGRFVKQNFVELADSWNRVRNAVLRSRLARCYSQARAAESPEVS